MPSLWTATEDLLRERLDPDPLRSHRTRRPGFVGHAQPARVDCPHCGRGFRLFIDVSAGSQRYVEDCTRCCYPLEVRVDARDHELLGVDVQKLF